MLGSGVMEQVKISLGPRKIERVKARHLPGGIVVFQEGIYDGKIGVPYWENQLFHEALKHSLNGRNYRRYQPGVLIFQVLPDVYTALRQTLHILHGNYGRTFRMGEKLALQRALAASEVLHEHVLGLRRGTLRQLYAKVQRAAEKIIEQVGTQPRDENKKQAIDLAAEIGKVVDKLGRANPSAKIAQLDALRRRLEERLGRIMSIEPKVIGRRQTLKTLIEICELRFAAAENFLTRCLPHLHQAYFEKHKGLAQKVAFRLELLARETGEIDIQPFTFPARKIVEEFQEAARRIRSRDFQPAYLLLLRSYESLKLRVIRTDMENFITFLTQLMFHQDRTLLPAELRKIRNGCNNIMRRLSTIDETGFAKPVCHKSLVLVSEARVHLNGGKNRLLKPVKEALARAAQLL